MLAHVTRPMGAPVAVLPTLYYIGRFRRTQLREGLLRALPEGLAALRRIDAIQADAYLFPVDQNCERVAVCHLHDAPGEVGERTARCGRQERR
jgi:hypothetical protein